MSNWCKEKLSNFVKYVQWEQVAVEGQSFYSKGWYERFVRIIDYTNREEAPRYIPYTGTKSLVGKDDIVMIRYWSQTAWKAVRWIPWVIANNMFRINIDKNREWKKIDKNFLFHYLSSKSIFDYLHKGWGSSTMPAISFNLMDDLWVCFPEDIEEQHKIAKILSTIDDKIELNNKINSELEAMAKELYEYWFVQFDFPDENGKPYKSSGWKMVWNEKLKREIPEWWSVENIKKNSLTELIKPWIDNFNWEKKYLATAEVTNNDINFGAPKITYENRESRANMQPIENSVWFAKMKNSKKVLYFWEYSVDFIENFILSTGFAWLKCKTNNSLEYVRCNINNDYFETLKDRLSNWATQEAINNDAMAFIPLVIPNNFVLEMFHKKTKSIYEQIYLNQLQNRDLAELRDFLLPMLMNGQVTVK